MPDGSIPGGQLDATSSEARPAQATGGADLTPRQVDPDPTVPLPGGQLDVTSSEAAPAQVTGGDQLDVTSSDSRPDGSPTGGEASYALPIRPDFPGTGADTASLDVTSSDPGPHARARASAHAPPRAPLRAVRSFVDDIETRDILDTEIINEQTNRARAREEAPPGWWRTFLGHLDNLADPRPKRPAWQELLEFQDPADPDLIVMQEACGRFLDTYCHPASPAVGRVRGAVRAIYRNLMVQALRLPGGVDQFSARCWAARYYLTLMTAEEAQDWLEEAGRTGVPRPLEYDEPIPDHWPEWCVRLHQHFPDLPDYDYLGQKGEDEHGLDYAALVRVTEATIQGCKHPQGALQYWLRTCATEATKRTRGRR